MEFIEDIQKEKMLAIRNVSKGTWDEFVKLRAK